MGFALQEQMPGEIKVIVQTFYRRITKGVAYFYNRRALSTRSDGSIPIGILDYITKLQQWSYP